MANIKEGDLVTWGSGLPLAKVVCLKDVTDVDTGEAGVPGARVSLVKDAKAQCGMVFPAGEECDIPLYVLRQVQ